MSHRAESSSASRSQRGDSSLVAQTRAYPVGSETGLPLIVCPECNQGRVVELRVKQDTPNKGRSFFVCSRNGNPKLCGFYKFQRDYFNVLVDMKIINVTCEEIVGQEEVEDTDPVKDLEKKMEKMMRQMHLFVVLVAIFVFGFVVKSIGST